IDDGIERWDPVRREVLAAAGRARLLQAPAVVQFLPASGAASRMFADLAAAFGEEPAPAWRSLEARAWRGELAARSVLRLLADLPRLPFAEALAAELAQQGEDLETLRRRGRWRPLLAALLG